VRRAALSAAGLLLLAGPTGLAFFSGGYFGGPRAWAGLAAWLIVALGLLAAPRAVPRTRGSWAALGGLGALAGITLLSVSWAPVATTAYHFGQIACLYLGALLAGALVLRGGAVRWAEPALGAGILIVIGYGVSERLLPGLLQFSRSVSAQGRLEQPLTYWNAMGELAAIGFVICTRIAGDGRRQAWLRMAALAGTAPLGMGLYISFSRGALFACLAGLLALVAVAPRFEQLRAVLLAALVGTLASIASAPFHGVTGLAGSLGTRESQGAITLLLVVLVALAGGLAQRQLIRHSAAGELCLPRRSPLIAVTLIFAGLTLAIVLGAKESSTASQPLSAGANRLVTLQSNRYAYWRVALRAFTTEPLHGVGAGGWRVYWLRWRKIGEYAQDAHSLPLQTLAELGLIGLAALAAFLAGVVLVARRALRVSPAAAAGPIAAFVVYLAHSPLDWDWEMPAVTLVAMVLVGALIAIAPAGSTGQAGAGAEPWPRAPRRSAVPRA